jgi:predicted nucleic acid-binding protein
LLNRIAPDDVVGYVNTQVLSDLLHKLMLAEAAAKGSCGFSAKKLKNWLAGHRQQAGTLTAYQVEFENTLKLGIKVMHITKTILVDTKTERATHGLMTGDSLHLGNMNRHAPAVIDIATHDGDFEHIAGLTVWKPMDVIP